MTTTSTMTADERRSQIVWFLRASISPDEAESMASPGYRSLPCGGCARLSCQFCDRDPAESVKAGAHGKRGIDARHVRAIVARFGQFPGPVLARTSRGLAKLPPLERLVLVLHDGAGLTQTETARRLKVSQSAVSRARDRALEALSRHVWETPA